MTNHLIELTLCVHTMRMIQRDASRATDLAELDKLRNDLNEQRAVMERIAAAYGMTLDTPTTTTTTTN